MSRWDDEYRLCPWSITQEAQGEAEDLDAFGRFMEGVKRSEEMGIDPLAELTVQKQEQEGQRTEQVNTSETLGLYKVSRTETEWEEPHTFLVVAESADQARQLYPDPDFYKGCKWRAGIDECGDEQTDGKKGVWIDDENFAEIGKNQHWVQFRDEWNWPAPEDLIVEYLCDVARDTLRNQEVPCILLIAKSGS